MKKNLITVLTLGLIIFSTTSYGQNTEVVKLNQTPGKFTQTTLRLEPGQYQFEVSNNGVDHEVGFVVAPKGKEEDATQHLSDAYLVKTILDGETAKSNVVNLEAGTYSYFCPLNPTPMYTLIVGTED